MKKEVSFSTREGAKPSVPEGTMATYDLHFGRRIDVANSVRKGRLKASESVDVEMKNGIKAHLEEVVLVLQLQNMSEDHQELSDDVSMDVL